MSKKSKKLPQDLDDKKPDNIYHQNYGLIKCKGEVTEIGELFLKDLRAEREKECIVAAVALIKALRTAHIKVTDETYRTLAIEAIEELKGIEL